jgi:hypothetical protein
MSYRGMTRSLVPYGFSLLALAACNVTEIPGPPSTVAVNECSGNDECPGGACVDGACVTGSGDLGNVIVEVTPPPGGALPSLPYYTALGNKLSDNLLLQPAARVAGYVTLHPDDCAPTFQGDGPGSQLVPVEGTIPVDVTFTASVRTLGLATRSYRSLSLEVDAKGRHGFELTVPPGEYDVYIEPKATTADSPCQIPPWLLLRQRITTSGPYDVKLSRASSINVPVHWPTGSLDNYQVEILDSVSGRVLSAPAVLGNPGQDENGLAFYQRRVTFSQVLEPNEMNELVVSQDSYELVRISPPAETIAPSILGEASAIGLSASNAGGILLSNPLPAPVTVEAQTGESGTSRPVAAAVTVRATRIEGLDEGLYASFVRTYQVGEAGVFQAILPPGDYLVESIPKDSSIICEEEPCPLLASRRDTWKVGVAPELQAGKLIQFQRAPVVTGTAFTATGKPVSGAVVRVTSSVLAPPPDFWNFLDREGDLSSRATTGIVDGRGVFDLSADPGSFDLFVQPNPSTRFGWYVRPKFTVDQRDDTRATGPITVPLARRHAGRILIGPKVSGQPSLPNALLRAYVHVTPDGEYAAAPVQNGSVLQVAETRSNAAGDFELLIPASLDSPTPAAE